MDLNGDHDLSFCDGCVYASKQYCTPFLLNGGFHAKEILGLVHTNLFGFMVTTFHVGAKYFLIVIDNLSRKTFFNIMKTKFGVFDKLKVFKALVKNQIGKKFKTIKYDGGEKYNLKNFNTFYKENKLVLICNVIFKKRTFLE
jgi:hypothetical protein